MTQYLLTGATGTLGQELQKYLDCIPLSSKDFDITQFNSKETQGFETRMGDKLEDVSCLVHCAAYTDVPGAEKDKYSAVTTNITGTQNMAEYAHDRGWKFVYLSTDYVFPGLIGNYSEQSKTEPFNFYSFTKLAGECFAAQRDLIIRTSFKPSDLWETKYNRAFTNLYTSADYVDVIAPHIAFAIYSNLSGVYNIGTERKSIYDLAYRRNPDVEQADTLEVSRIVNMPRDISMNSTKYWDYYFEHVEEFKAFVDGAKNDR